MSVSVKTKAQVRASERVPCEGMRVEQRWEGGGGLRVKDRWSLSGVVPPLPLSFSLPSGSDIFSLSPLQNLTSSVFFVFFLPSAPFIISSFTLLLKVSTRIFTHFAALLSLQTPFLPFPSSSAFLSGFLLKKSTWKHQEISLWLSFWPLLTQHKRHQRGLGFVGTNKKKGSDWQLWPMNNSDYFPQYHSVLLDLLLPGCILMYLRTSQKPHRQFVSP